MAMCSAAVFIILKLKVRTIARKAMLMIATLRIVTMMNVSAAVYRGGGAGAGRPAGLGGAGSSSSRGSKAAAAALVRQQQRRRRHQCHQQHQLLLQCTAGPPLTVAQVL